MLSTAISDRLDFEACTAQRGGILLSVFMHHAHAMFRLPYGVILAELRERGLAYPQSECNDWRYRDWTPKDYGLRHSAHVDAFRLHAIKNHQMSTGDLQNVSKVSL